MRSSERKKAQGGKQEAPQPALVWTGFLEKIAPEKLDEKSLHEILGIRRRMTAMADEAIKRMPVDAAEFVQSLAREERVRPARSADERPAGGREFPFSVRCGWVIHRA